jgi:hypothetical protein
MQSKSIGRIWVFIAIGAATSAAVAGMRVYVVRELMVEMLFFCILFVAMGIAVIVLLAMDEIVLRAFMWVRTQMTCAHLHFRHAAAGGNVITAAHKT